MTSALPKARSTTHGTLMAMDDLAPLRNGSERFAARIVRQATGAAIVPRDGVTGRALQHDFDAVTGFGQAVAVEVTSATDGRLRKLGVELSRTPTNIRRLRGPSWSVDVRSDADLRKVRASVEEVIAELEAEGLEAFSFSVWEDTPVGAPHVRFASHEEDRWTAGMRRAHQLRLHWGRIIHARPAEPVILLSRPPAAATADPTVVVRAVEVEAEANKKKLERSRDDGYTHRHLFICIDHTRWDLEFAHQRGDVTRAEAPDLPDAVTGVWVASDPPVGRVAVWRFDRQHGWREVDVDVSVMGGEPS